MGRPAKPLELKRLSGQTNDTDSGGRKLTPKSETIELAPAKGTPEPPQDLKEAGILLWNRAWVAASGWISPESDRSALERACRLADLEKVLFQIALEHPTQQGVVTRFVEVTHALGQALSVLGFDPSARSKLGVAEIKAKSKLEEMQMRREVSKNG